jgi:serine/threonine protein kinase
MSLEAMLGSPEASADLFSFGITFFQMLTGRKLPFPTSSDMGQIALSRQLSVRSLLPIIAANAGPQQREAIFPLDTLILQLLAQRPFLRPSLTKVEEMLEQWLRRYRHIDFPWGQRIFPIP